MTLAILERSIVLLEDGKEASEDLLSEDTIGVLGCMVGKEATKEENTSITRNHTGDGAIVEVGIDGNAVLEAANNLISDYIHGNDTVLIGAVVQVTEQSHIHGPGISCEIEVVACEGCIRLKPVVCPL